MSMYLLLAKTHAREQRVYLACAQYRPTTRDPATPCPLRPLAPFWLAPPQFCTYQVESYPSHLITLLVCVRCLCARCLCVRCLCVRCLCVRCPCVRCQMRITGASNEYRASALHTKPQACHATKMPLPTSPTMRGRNPERTPGPRKC